MPREFNLALENDFMHDGLQTPGLNHLIECIHKVRNVDDLLDGFHVRFSSRFNLVLGNYLATTCWRIAALT